MSPGLWLAHPLGNETTAGVCGVRIEQLLLSVIDVMLTPMRPHPSRRRLAAVALVGALAATGIVALPTSAQAKTFTFYGRAWGHGLGMSQWGARGLAEKGYSSSRILGTYYKGTKVESKSVPAEIRVGLLQERSDISVTGDGPFTLHDKNGVKKATGAEGQSWKIVPNSTGSRLEVFKSSAKIFSSPVPVTIRYPTSTRVKLPQTGYRYKRGRIDIDINSATKKARAIMMVNFEEYLYGLGEMPSSWHNEALKAQAIAGRTYALEKVQRLGQNRSVCNCGVYASTADQAYVGYEHEVERWTSAVKATKGQVVTYGGKPIQAFYSASSGGHTENNEYVFGGSAIPYLRGVCDPGDFNGGSNPHSNWTVQMSDAKVAERMQAAGYNVGPVQSISYPSPKGVSGRVRSVIDSNSGGVTVKGALGTARINGSKFRSMLSLKSDLIGNLIYGGIRKRYDALNCKPGIAKSNEYTWKNLDGSSNGRAQDFKKGRIFYNPGKGVFWIFGGIGRAYDALRSRRVDLRLPINEEFGIAGGKAVYFQKGRIYWSSATGAHEVHGGILGKYLQPGGPAKWGFPVADEQSAPGGRLSRFQKARIYWTSKHGAHVVYGGILKRYLELGGASSDLGLPITDEFSTSYGRRSNFQHGYIKWDRNTGKTSYRVTG